MSLVEYDNRDFGDMTDRMLRVGPVRLLATHRPERGSVPNTTILQASWEFDRFLSAEIRTSTDSGATAREIEFSAVHVTNREALARELHRAMPYT